MKHSPAGDYLRLRLRAAFRWAREVGWLRLAPLGLFSLIGMGQVLVLAAGHPLGQWAVPLLTVWSLLAAHRQRADYRFLATVAPDFKPWLALEYGLVSLPIAIALLSLRAVGPAALTLVLAAPVAWAPPAKEGRATRHRWRSPFRSEAFEWVGGMRATQGLLVWLVLLAGAIWQRASPLAPITALLLWLLVVLACYGTAEPSMMLAVAAQQPKPFLQRRLVLGLGYAACTAMPFWLLLATGPAGWGAALAIILVWLGLVALVIVAKYAFYPNATQFRSTQLLVIAVVLLLVGSPLYPVLLLVIVSGLPWQSRRRLRTVLGQELRDEAR
jgi:hypothetical protein